MKYIEIILLFLILLLTNCSTHKTYVFKNSDRPNKPIVVNVKDNGELIIWKMK